jgi:hypothetical protein
MDRIDRIETELSESPEFILSILSIYVHSPERASVIHSFQYFRRPPNTANSNIFA